MTITHQGMVVCCTRSPVWTDHDRHFLHSWHILPFFCVPIASPLRNSRHKGNSANHPTYSQLKDENSQRYPRCWVESSMQQKIVPFSGGGLILHRTLKGGHCVSVAAMALYCADASVAAMASITISTRFKTHIVFLTWLASLRNFFNNLNITSLHQWTGFLMPIVLAIFLCHYECPVLTADTEPQTDIVFMDSN